MQCCYCLETDEAVLALATCNGTCGGAVFAHRTCFTARRNTPVYKKKMKQRSNKDAEVCPKHGCLGKITPNKKESIRTNVKQQSSPVCPVIYSHESYDNSCSFLGQDGLPCRRRAEENGACHRHQKDLRIMQNMIGPTSKDAESQTEYETDSLLSLQFKKLQVDILALQKEKQEAERRLASIRTNVLELLLDTPDPFSTNAPF